MSDDTKRWAVNIYYFSESGTFTTNVQIEELAELHDIIEAGPNWNTIAKIEITLLRRSEEITYEEAVRDAIVYQMGKEN